MRKIFGLAIVALVCFSACESKKTAMSKSEIKAKVDSMVAVKLDEISQQASEDLDRRKSIEVKAKADSIVEAYMKTQTPPPAPAN